MCPLWDSFNAERAWPGLRNRGWGGRVGAGGGSLNSGAFYLTRQPIDPQEAHKQYWGLAHLLQSQKAPAGRVSIISEHQPWEVAMMMPIL